MVPGCFPGLTRKSGGGLMVSEPHSTVGCDMSWPISANRLRMKMISVAASDAAMISASVVEIEIDCCRLLLASNSQSGGGAVTVPGGSRNVLF